MEKKVFLAFVLSLLVLLIWGKFAPKVQPPVPSVNIQELPKNNTVTAIAESASLPPPYFELEKNNVTYVFSEPLAAIKEVKFNFYQGYNFPIQKGFLSLEDPLSFTKQILSDSEVVFTHLDASKKIVKRFVFPKINYDIDLSVEVENLSKDNLNVDLSLVLGEINFLAKKSQANFDGAIVSTAETISRPNIRKTNNFNNLKFIGLKDQYFCAIIEPATDKFNGFIKKNKNSSEIGISNILSLAPGQLVKEKFRIYLGPQDLKQISAINPSWAAIIHFGNLDIIGQILLQLLDVLFKLVHNWGIVIILVSILIYGILFPLSIKQMRSMKDVQALQPKVDALRVTYKDNPQRMNKEIFELYRINKVNPYSGCLPLILQIPVFFALYQVLVRSVALKGAHFLWIKDLSAPDRFFVLTQPVNFEFNLLPLLMVFAMFFQQKMNAANSSNAMNEQQKMLTIVFPIVFGFVFYNMPSGLVLYWFINNILMLVTQLKISKNA